MQTPPRRSTTPVPRRGRVVRATALAAVASLGTTAAAVAAPAPNSTPKITIAASKTHPSPLKPGELFRSDPEVLKVTVRAQAARVPKGRLVATLVRGSRRLAVIGSARIPAIAPAKRRSSTITINVPDDLPAGPAFYRVCLGTVCASTRVELIRYPESYTGTLEVTATSTRYGDSQRWSGTVVARPFSGTGSRSSAGQYIVEATALTVTGTWHRGGRTGARAECQPITLTDVPVSISNTTGGGLLFEDDRLSGPPRLSPGVEELTPLVPSPTRVSGTLALATSPQAVSCTAGAGGPQLADVVGEARFADDAQRLFFRRTRHPNVAFDYTYDLGDGPTRVVLKLTPKW